MIGRIAVRAGRAFDGKADNPDATTVLVENGRIVGRQSAATPVPELWPLADFPDATVLPGLVDAHTHLCGDSKDDALERLADFTDEELAAVIEEGVRRNLAVGVTTVRDLGDRRWAVLEWRDHRRADDATPAIVASGPPITSMRGHCWNMGGEVEGGDQLRAAVQKRAERGVDVIKIMASGGVVTPGTDVMGCQFTLAEMRLVVDAAHGAGLPITAHAHGLLAVEQALDAGVDGIEHCSCTTQSGIRVPEELLHSLAEARTAVCPTLGIAAGLSPPPAVLALLEGLGLTPEEARARQLQRVTKFHDAGVRLVSGSDGGISEGKAHGILPRSIAELVMAGVPADTALASATSVAAEVCGVGARKGLLQEGYDADLLIVAGNPFTDIGALANVSAVMVNGSWVGSANDRRS